MNSFRIEKKSLLSYATMVNWFAWFIVSIFFNTFDENGSMCFMIYILLESFFIKFEINHKKLYIDFV